MERSWPADIGRYRLRLRRPFHQPDSGKPRTMSPAELPECGGNSARSQILRCRNHAIRHSDLTLPVQKKNRPPWMAVENLLARILLRFHPAGEYGANTPENTFSSSGRVKLLKRTSRNGLKTNMVPLKSTQGQPLSARPFSSLIGINAKGGPTQGRLNLTNHHYKEPR